MSDRRPGPRLAPAPPRCQFGLCERAAELVLEFPGGLDPVLVCGWHVTPVLSWGVAHPADPHITALLSAREHPPRQDAA